MNDTTFLYELKDPRNGESRYVGKAKNPFLRFKRHLQCRERTPVYNWIRSLKSGGLVPHMELLDEVPISQWQFWEREYIRVYRLIGVRLLNLSEGGDGCDGYRHTDESRNRMRASQKGNTNSLGHKQSLLHREKHSKLKLGRTFSSEHRAKLSLARSGNKNAVGNKSCVGRVLSEETKQKISESHKRMWASRKGSH